MTEFADLVYRSSMVARLLDRIRHGTGIPWLFLVLSTGLSVNLSAEAPSAGGPCVLLKNGNVLLGTADQIGSRVQVTTKTGRVVLPSAQVACWADSIVDLYQYRVEHRQGDPIASRLADAQWCLDHQLLDLAKRELDALLAMDVSGTRFESLRVRFSQAIRRRRFPSTVQQVGFQVATADADQRHEKAQRGKTEFHRRTLSTFTRDIQPLLLNRCASCHDARNDQAFGLITLGARTRPSAAITFQNLSNTWKFANRSSDDPNSLIGYATRVHGDSGTPPIGRGDGDAIETLQRWLQEAAANESGTLQHARNALVADENPQPTSLNPMNQAKDIDSDEKREISPTDPFDPAKFNQLTESVFEPADG